MLRGDFVSFMWFVKVFRTFASTSAVAPVPGKLCARTANTTLLCSLLELDFSFQFYYFMFFPVRLSKFYFFPNTYSFYCVKRSVYTILGL